MPAGDMDSEYSIGVHNRFIGIDSDMLMDPLDIIRAAQEQPRKEKEAKGKGTKKDVKQSNKNTKEKSVKVESTVQSPTENKRTEYNSDRPRGRGRGRGRGGDRGRGRGGRGGGFGSSNNEEYSSSSHDGPRPPRGACHRCGEEGHFVRNCPQQTKSAGAPMSSDGGFGAPSSGGFGSSSGGFDSPSGGFGAPQSGGFGNDGEERQGGRGGYRGGRGGRGGRGRGRGGGAREFDRRSGSDRSSVKAFDKRDGSGSYNWGTPQDDLAASEEQQAGGFGAPKESDDAPVESTEETHEAGNVSGSDENENKENAGVPEMSFADYKKQQEGSRIKPQYNIRKANEGEKLKGLKQLKKPSEEDNEADGSLFFPKKYYEEKVKMSGRVKEHLNCEFQYGSGENRHMDTDRGRRGGGGRRGGRGGGRGGRSRDESSGFGSSSKIQLENAEEFPSLG